MKNNSFLKFFTAKLLGKDELDPIENIIVAVRHIVDDNYLSRCLLDDTDDGVRANETQSSRNEQSLNFTH